MTKLHVGNLSSEVTNDGLRQLFTDHGYVITSARVICDREGGRSRGFGFVEFDSTEAAEKALDEFNGFEMLGRALQVRHARPHGPRDGRVDSGRSRAAADTRVG